VKRFVTKKYRQIEDELQASFQSELTTDNRSTSRTGKYSNPFKQLGGQRNSRVAFVRLLHIHLLIFGFPEIHFLFSLLNSDKERDENIPTHKDRIAG